jgi:hypothetical protein
VMEHGFDGIEHGFNGFDTDRICVSIAKFMFSVKTYAIPPLTESVWPFTKDASSEAKNK